MEGTKTKWGKRIIIIVTMAIGLAIVGVIGYLAYGIPSAPEYEWGPWSACSRSGYMTRSQLCDSENCIEELAPCLYYEATWSEWSLCSNQSGSGFRSRNRLCGNLAGCFQYRDQESCTVNSSKRPGSVFIGDGYCDDRFNIPADGWDFDGGDCCGEAVSKMFCEQCFCLEGKFSSKAYCAYSIAVGNKVCDDFANIEECQYDGGDCCGKDSDYSFCNDCKCKTLDVGESLVAMKEYVESRCPVNYLKSIGDLFCHDELNNEDCNFDGGDCCLTNKAINVCNDCECLQNETAQNITQFIKPCPYEAKNDGFCNDVLNIPECNYDDSDCCGDTDLSRCTECTCKDPRNTVKRKIRKCGLPAFKNNGKCDDLNNIKECDWDGGDCCGCYMEKGFCSDCSCKDPDFIPLIDSEKWCCKFDLMHNGICDQINNVRECNYDALDCCSANDVSNCKLPERCAIDLVKNNKCDIALNISECLYDFGACLQPLDILSLMCNSLILGDHICDLENYFPECDFDQGDCNHEQQDSSSITILTGLGADVLATDRIVTLNVDGSTEYNYPRFPKSIKFAVIAETQSNIYVCGGSDDTDSAKKLCYKLEKQPDTDGFYLWQSIAEMKSSRVEFTMVSVEDGSLGSEVLWAAGGTSKEVLVSGDITSLQAETSEVYNPAYNAWIYQMPIFDVAISGHCSIKVGKSKVLVVGGYDTSGFLMKGTMMYHFGQTKTTTPSGDMRVARKYHNCGVFKARNGLDAGYAIGGIGMDDAFNEVQLASVEMYYFQNEKWTLINALPQNLQHTTSAVISNRVLIMGGMTSSISQDVIYIHNHKTFWHKANFVTSGVYGHISLVIDKLPDKIATQPNFIVLFGMGSSADSVVDFEFVCFGMDPMAKYCSGALPNLALVQRVGAYIYQADELIHVCGGALTDSSTNKLHLLSHCDSWSMKTFQFKQNSTVTPIPASFAAFLQNPKHDMIISGGVPGHLSSFFLGTPSKASFIVDKLGVVKQGKNLPIAVSGHCMVHVERHYYALIGGFNSALPVASMLSFLWNLLSGDHLQLPYLKLPRANHFCLKFYLDGVPHIIAAGGRYFLNPTTEAIISASEVLNVETVTWESGPDLPFPLAFASVATTDRNSYIFGGKTALNEVSNKVLTLKMQGSSLFWETLPYELAKARFSSATWTLSNQNFFEAQKSQTDFVPKSKMTPYDQQEQKRICSETSNQAPFCLAKHLLTITNTKVTDFVFKHGKLVRSQLYYPDWVQSVVQNRNQYVRKMKTVPAIGYAYSNSFFVIGGELRDKITTFPFGFTSSYIGILDMGNTPEEQVSAGHAKVGDRLWIVGGINRLEEKSSKTSLIINGQLTEGPDLNFEGTLFPLEGACVSSLNDYIGFLAGGMSENGGVLRTAFSYDFSKSLTNVKYWTRLASMPRGGRFFTACGRFRDSESGNMDIFLVGGVESLALDNAERKFYPKKISNFVLKYDIEMNHWTSIPANFGLLFGGTLVPVSENKLYYLGAFDEKFETHNLYLDSNGTWLPLLDNLEFTSVITADTVFIPYEFCDNCL